MKRFHFALERVRRWRDGQAMLEELKLEQLRDRLLALGVEKRGIAAERSRSEQQVLGQATVDAGQLQSLDAYRLHVRNKIREIESRERQAEVGMEQQRQRVIQARRETELLERLKRKELAEWSAANDREQEALASELYLGKWKRRGA